MVDNACYLHRMLLALQEIHIELCHWRGLPIVRHSACYIFLRCIFHHKGHWNGISTNQKKICAWHHTLNKAIHHLFTKTPCKSNRVILVAGENMKIMSPVFKRTLEPAALQYC